jgi:hypothetical protein
LALESDVGKIASGTNDADAHAHATYATGGAVQSMQHLGSVWQGSGSSKNGSSKNGSGSDSSGGVASLVELSRFKKRLAK